MRSPALEAFEIDKEKAAVRERYGANEFGRGALLARRLVEKGVRFVQVNRGGFDVAHQHLPRHAQPRRGRWTRPWPR